MVERRKRQYMPLVQAQVGTSKRAKISGCPLLICMYLLGTLPSSKTLTGDDLFPVDQGTLALLLCLHVNSHFHIPQLVLQISHYYGVSGLLRHQWNFLSKDL